MNILKFSTILLLTTFPLFSKEPVDFLFAPHEYDYTKNIISVEAGTAFFFSGFGATYERSFSKSFSVRGSAGYIVYNDLLVGSGNINTFYPSGSAHGVYVFGNEGWGLEVSGGVTYLRNVESEKFKNVVFPSVGLGLRYKPITEGIFFRTGFGVSASWVGVGVGVGFAWRD